LSHNNTSNTSSNYIIMAETAAPIETSITCPCGKSTVKTAVAPMGACVCHCFECRKMTQGMFGSKRIYFECWCHTPSLLTTARRCSLASFFRSYV
jgi:hypothetical protein